ncbi:hypothetical protein NNRS527_01920 [Nitrosospira sp. NRS527]|nr:hypothetical protein NNRS527_01920 [Nitrosospira sp. NRS527]
MWAATLENPGSTINLLSKKGAVAVLKIIIRYKVESRFNVYIENKDLL